MLKWPNNDYKRRDKAEKDSAASSLLKLLGTSGEADDEHGNNEADSSSASGESWDNDDSSDSSDNPNLVKEPRVPEEVEKGDDTDSLIGVRGHLVKQMKFQRKLKRVTIRIPSLALKGRKLKAMKLQNLTTVVKRKETL